MKNHVSFVLSSHSDSTDLVNVIYDLNLDYMKMNNISDLYQLLSKSDYYTDLIIVDIKNLYSQPGTNCFEIIDTIHTLLKTFHSDHLPLLAVTACLKTDPYLLKEILGTGIAGVFPHGDSFSESDKSDALSELLAGIKHIPKKITFLISNTKKYAKIINEDLTFRQRQVYKLIHEQGLSNKAIARILDISESAVKSHIGKVLKKYGVRNRTQLALITK